MHAPAIALIGAAVFLRTLKATSLLYARGYVEPSLRLQTECELTTAHMFKPTKCLSSTGVAATARKAGGGGT